MIKSVEENKGVNTMITNKEVKQILSVEIPFNELKKNGGIYEFSEIGDISFGVSYEDDEDGNECYIYNLFVGGEYINISAIGSSEEFFNDMVISEIVENLNKILS